MYGLLIGILMANVSYTHLLPLPTFVSQFFIFLLIYIYIYIYIYIFDYLIGMAFAASKKGLLWDLVSNKDSYLWSNASGIL